MGPDPRCNEVFAVLHHGGRQHAVFVPVAYSATTNRIVDVDEIRGLLRHKKKLPVNDRRAATETVDAYWSLCRYRWRAGHKAVRCRRQMRDRRARILLKFRNAGGIEHKDMVKRVEHAAGVFRVPRFGITRKKTQSIGKSFGALNQRKSRFFPVFCQSTGGNEAEGGSPSLDPSPVFRRLKSQPRQTTSSDDD